MRKKVRKKVRKKLNKSEKKVRNKLEEIGEDLLNYASNLKKANFSDNKCINEDSETVDVNNVIEEIINRCNLPGKCGYLDTIDGNLI